jgi:hypothetical protein
LRNVHQGSRIVHGRARLIVAATLVDSHPYVEEDQEAQGAHASQQGEPRQAPEHGPLTNIYDAAAHQK